MISFFLNGGDHLLCRACGAEFGSRNGGDLNPPNMMAAVLWYADHGIPIFRLLEQGPGFLKLGSAVRYRPEDISAGLECRQTGGGDQGSEHGV